MYLLTNIIDDARYARISLLKSRGLEILTNAASEKLKA